MAKKTSKQKITPKEVQPSPADNPNAEQYFLWSIYDILDLSTIKLPPQEEWKLISRQHKVDEIFNTGLLGKDGYLLLKSIAGIYESLLKDKPPIAQLDKDGNVKNYHDFTDGWNMIDCITIDHTTKTVEMFLGKLD